MCYSSPSKGSKGVSQFHHFRINKRVPLFLMEFWTLITNLIIFFYDVVLMLHRALFLRLLKKYTSQSSQPKMVKKPEKVGGQKVATQGPCRGRGGAAPSRRKQGGMGAEPPATENFFIFYLKQAIFGAFNCIICCNNVLCTMYYTNAKCSDM